MPQIRGRRRGGRVAFASAAVQTVYGSAFIIEALRAKGVTELWERAGTRGAGPQLGTLYRRLGFNEAGQLYRKEL